MIFDFSPEKNKILKLQRDITFEEVIEEIENAEIDLDIIPHSNTIKYPNQFMFIIKMKGYIYSIPFIKNENKIFLKTIFPDRRLLKKYNLIHN
ncbi:MAG: toxin [Candidatus Gracilibacteria bacterium]|nr:toxin [Candidatus Gracilibacteria bacterium]